MMHGLPKPGSRSRQAPAFKERREQREQTAIVQTRRVRHRDWAFDDYQFPAQIAGMAICCMRSATSHPIRPAKTSVGHAFRRQFLQHAAPDTEQQQVVLARLYRRYGQCVTAGGGRRALRAPGDCASSLPSGRTTTGPGNGIRCSRAYASTSAAVAREIANTVSHTGSRPSIQAPERAHHHAVAPFGTPHRDQVVDQHREPQAVRLALPADQCAVVRVRPCGTEATA